METDKLTAEMELLKMENKNCDEGQQESLFTSSIISKTAICASSTDDCSLNPKRKLESDDQFQTENNSVIIEEEMDTKRLRLALTDGSDGDPEDCDVEVEVPPHEIALAFNHVLASIFSSMSLKDLKTCRRVNSQWKEEATKSILQNQVTKSIKWSYYQDGFVGLHFSNKFEHTDTFVARTVALKSKAQPPLPFNSFCMSTDNLHPSDSSQILLQQFLEAHGKYIKELSIIGETNKNTPLREFENLIARQLPNLEKLTIYSIPNDWNSPAETSRFLKFHPLRKLKTFLAKCRNHLNFLRCILNSSPNLKFVDSNHKYDSDSDILSRRGDANCISDFLKLFVQPEPGFGFGPGSSKTVSLLQNYVFVGEGLLRERIVLYEILAGFCPKFKSLEFRSIFRYEEESQLNLRDRFVKVINECLESSAGSLVEIHELTSLLRLPGIKLPAMPKLRDIAKWRFDCDALNLDGTFFDKFPNLVGLYDFINANSSNHDMGLGDRKIKPHESLKHLLFIRREYINPPSLNYFSQQFPNLTMARFPRISNFLEASQFLWKLTQLTFLEISFSLDGGCDSEANRNPYPECEMGFTGFSKDTCLSLRNVDSSEVDGGNLNVTDGVEVNDLRLNLSILNLKNLKRLMLLIDLDYNSEPWDGSPILTHVTGIYGFKMCPVLEVTVDIVSYHKESIKTGLVGVLPCIHSIN